VARRGSLHNLNDHVNTHILRGEIALQVMTVLASVSISKSHYLIVKITNPNEHETNIPNLVV
jgi:hypothetical protein